VPPVLADIDLRKQLAVHDQNRRIETEVGFELLGVAEVHQTLSAGILGSIANRRRRVEIALQKREDIRVLTSNCFGSKHTSSGDLIASAACLGRLSSHNNRLLCAWLCAEEPQNTR
jgi:hypothetical protein